MTNRASNDRLLFARLRERDPRALADLVAHYFDKLVSFSLRRVGDPTLARDVAEAVCVAAWRSAALAREPVILTSWLFGIAQFKCAAAVAGPAPTGTHPR